MQIIKYSFCLLWLTSVYSLLGQDSTPSAKVGAFGKYIDQPVSHFTGTSSISVPIANVSDGTLSTSVSLNYHTGGVRVSELASPYGLGWSLSGGGAISRTIRGIADDNKDKYGYYDYGLQLNESSGHIDEVEAGDRDAEPDIFSYYFGNKSGKFYFDKSKMIQFIPQSNILVDVIRDVFSEKFVGFIITDTDGTKYLFGNYQQQNSTQSIESQQIGNGTEDNVTWSLVKIESADSNDSINFVYSNSFYKYSFLSDCEKYSAHINGTTDYHRDCISS